MPRVNRDNSRELAWAFRFAQADLTGWRDGDWLNALDDAMAFLGSDDAPPSARALQIPSRARVDLLNVIHERSVPEAKKLLAALQPRLRQFFEHLFRARTMVEMTVKPAIAYAQPIPFSGEALYFVRSPSKLEFRPSPRAGTVADQFATEALLRAGDLLTRVDLARMRRCPECERLFLAVRRQRFDSQQCSLRDRVRRFRRKGRGKRARPAASATRSSSS